MITITNNVTFIEKGPSVNAVKITGGEKYHTHTRAVSSILQLVDSNTRFEFSYLSPTEGDSEGKIQFVIIGTSNSIISGRDGEFQIYSRFAQKLKSLLDEAANFHHYHDQQDYDNAIKLNKRHSGKLETIAKQLSIIERDLELTFNTEASYKIPSVTAKKLTKQPVLTTNTEHKEYNVLIDCYAKFNKSKKITVSLVDASTFKNLGTNITIKDDLISYVKNAYLNDKRVDITVLNKDKINQNSTKLSGELIDIEDARQSDAEDNAKFEEF